jgi:hypothetical protein
MDTAEALKWFSQAKKERRAYASDEEEKKRKGQVGLEVLAGKQRMGLQGLVGSQQLDIESAKSSAAQSLETLKTDLAKPLTTAQIGYYGGLATQARAVGANQAAEARDKNRTLDVIPPGSSRDAWYARSGVTNPFTADLSTTPGPAPLPLLPYEGTQSPISMESVFPSQAPSTDPNTPPFEKVPPLEGVMRGAKKVGNKFVDWLGEGATY